MFLQDKLRTKLYIKPAARFLGIGIESVSHSTPITQPEVADRQVAKWNVLTKRVKTVVKKCVIRSFAVHNCHKI
jgi:hypothetical protein